MVQKEIQNVLTISGKNVPEAKQFTTHGNMGRALWFVALAALLTSGFYFWHFDNIFYPDSVSYIAPAKNLLTSHVFNGPDGKPETFRTPGYPLIMVPFLWAHLDLKSVVVFQHLLRILIILGTTVFTFSFTKNRRLALITAVILTIDFPFLEAAHSILTEMLFTAILATVYWILWNKANQPRSSSASFLTAGMLAGMSALVRPIGLFFFLPALVFIALFVPRLKLRASLMFLAGFLCFPLAWAAHNQHTVGSFTVSTVSAFNALEYRAAGSLAAERPGDFRANFQKAQTELEDESCLEMQRTYSRLCSQVTLVEKSGYYSRLARTIILQHPLGYLKAAARGASVMMLDGGPITLSGLAGTNWPTGMRVLMIYTLPVLILALYGLVTTWRVNRTFFVLAMLVIGYFVIISAGPEAYGRFRVPFLPIYAILAATGLDSIITRFLPH